MASVKSVDKAAAILTDAFPEDQRAVEKELGFTGKPDIEAYGIAEFNARCRENVQRHVDAFLGSLPHTLTAGLQRQGVRHAVAA